MSGIEHFGEDLDAVEREILHCARICGFDLDNAAAVSALFKSLAAPAHSRDELHRQRMAGLLALRARILESRGS